jgi:hypothetical protein
VKDGRILPMQISDGVKNRLHQSQSAEWCHRSITIDYFPSAHAVNELHDKVISVSSELFEPVKGFRQGRVGEGCKKFRFRLKLLDDGRVSVKQLLDGNFSVAQALVKSKVNGTKATEAENLKDCVAVVEDSVFGKEWDGR